MYEPGDILIAHQADGHWLKAFTFVREDEDSPGWLVVGDLSEDDRAFAAMMSVRADLVVRPNVVGACDDPQSVRNTPEPTPQPGRSQSEPSVTAAQCRQLFALGKSRGLDIDDLRAMTPAGSISALTRVQASALIDGMIDPSWSGSGARDQGSASGKQIGLILHLRNLLGFEETDFRKWLSKWFKVGGVDEIQDNVLAHRIIGGLIRMLERRQGTGDARQKPAFDRPSKAL